MIPGSSNPVCMEPMITLFLRVKWATLIGDKRFGKNSEEETNKKDSHEIFIICLPL
jgi:hypothetical protein